MEERNPYQPPSAERAVVAAARTPQPGSRLDFGRCLSFFFEDPDWMMKLLVGSVFSLLSMAFVGSFFVAGYMVRLVRRSGRGEALPLPEWDDLRGVFVDGAAAIGAYLSYLLPAGFLLFLPAVGVALVAEEGEPSIVVAIVGPAVIVVSSLALLAVMVVLPAAITRLAVRRSFGAAFEMQENIEFIKRNAGNYVLALLTLLLANFISQFGILLCCVGVFPAGFWAASVAAYAMGEVAGRDPVMAHQKSHVEVET